MRTKICIVNCDSPVLLYCRKQGDNCFDFINDIKLATDLTNDEIINILNNSRYYLYKYGYHYMFVV